MRRFNAMPYAPCALLFNVPPIHQAAIGMLGVFALAHDLQIATVFIGGGFDLIP